MTESIDMPAADARFMARALGLARRGVGRTAPNPPVGCVIVHGQEVVGEAYHERAGAPHAEAAALAAAGERARGATAYVTLEPCNHEGRTPPCSEALIRAGIARVVYAVADPTPRAAGGAARLAEAGVAVSTGVLADEAEELLAPYRTVLAEGRPLVLYKTAMTLDGKIATRSGQSRWITSEASRALVQRWRDEYDAVAVGISTVLLDDPLLTARVEGGRTPLKVVFDSVARTPVHAKLFDPDPDGTPARVVIFCGAEAPEARVGALRERGAEVLLLEGRHGRADIRRALKELAARDVLSVLLEGGGTLAWSFLEADLIDRVAWFIAPKLLGGTGKSPLAGLGVETMDEAFALENVETRRVEQDLLITGRVSRRETA